MKVYYHVLLNLWLIHSTGEHDQTPASPWPECHCSEGKTQCQCSRIKQHICANLPKAKFSGLNLWVFTDLLWNWTACILFSDQQKHQRPKKTWQRRLNGQNLPLVEENLRRLFALRMRISRRAKVETNLSGLFNERKIPHYVDPEVNLRNLFGIKQPRTLEKTEVVPVKG